MKRRTMDWKPIYGLDHPTWQRPECFFYASAEVVQASMVKTYGEGSGHVVVRLERATEEDGA